MKIIVALLAAAPMLLCSCGTAPSGIGKTRYPSGINQYLATNPIPAPAAERSLDSRYRPADYSYSHPASSYSSQALGGYASYSGGSDNTLRVRSDYMDGYRITDDDGNTTRVRPDYLGGYRATDDDGNVSRMRPDYLGGWRTTHEDGSVSRSRPDGLGGYRITDDEGNTTRLRSDGFGGYRGYDDIGNSYRIRSRGY